MLIYVKSRRVARHLNYKGKTNCQFEGTETGPLKLSGPQREDLFSGFPTMQNSNQPTQLQRLAKMLKFCVEQVYQLHFHGSEQQSR